MCLPQPSTWSSRHRRNRPQFRSRRGGNGSQCSEGLGYRALQSCTPLHGAELRVRLRERYSGAGGPGLGQGAASMLGTWLGITSNANQLTADYLK